MKESYGPWFNAERCAHCQQLLTEQQVLYSMGRCPLCGVRDEHACTLVRTTHHAARHVYVRGPWWWPFRKRVRTEIR